MDDFAVWKRVLNSDEVQNIYADGLAGQTFNTTLIAETSFEPSEGFTGFPSGGAGNLGTVVDNDGVEWTSTDGADIWNRADIPPDGIQALRMGEADPESCSITIPGADHGVSYVSFDYASYSDYTDADFSLSYRVDSGPWVEVWSTHVSGMSPDWDTHPWKSVIAPICVIGDVGTAVESGRLQGRAGG